MCMTHTTNTVHLHCQLHYTVHLHCQLHYMEHHVYVMNIICIVKLGCVHVHDVVTD